MNVRTGASLSESVWRKAIVREGSPEKALPRKMNKALAPVSARAVRKALEREGLPEIPHSVHERTHPCPRVL